MGSIRLQVKHHWLIVFIIQVHPFRINWLDYTRLRKASLNKHNINTKNKKNNKNHVGR